MKTLFVVSLLALIGAPAHAQKIDICEEGDSVQSTFKKLPCVLPAEESMEMIHMMLLQNPEFHESVRQSGLKNPTFDVSRVVVLGNRTVTGCGPSTGRERIVLLIQTIIESFDHGPTTGQEPHLINVYANILSTGYTSKSSFVTRMQKLKFSQNDLAQFPIVPSDLSVEQMMQEPMESPCATP